MSSKTVELTLKTAAIEAARRAGNLLRKGFGTQFAISQKSSQHDLVTEFDRLAEESIISYLRGLFPTHAFLAEESGPMPQKNSPVTWVIDPLDGTMNFARHIPLFCVSIAAMIGDVVEVGVIYNPLLDELFVAERGKGATLNGNKITVSPIKSIHNSVLATGFPYDSSSLREKCVSQFMDFLQIANPVRIIGSAALSLAYVSCGRFDIYWGSNLMPWDVAAGSLLIVEAGGGLTRFDGVPIDIKNVSNAIATNSLLHNEALKILK